MSTDLASTSTTDNISKSEITSTMSIGYPSTSGSDRISKSEIKSPTSTGVLSTSKTDGNKTSTGSTMTAGHSSTSKTDRINKSDIKSPMSTGLLTTSTNSAAFQVLNNDVIRDLIFSFVPRKDLATCSRLSKSMFKPAVKHLYEEIELEPLAHIYYHDRWEVSGRTKHTRYRRELYRRSVRSLDCYLEDQEEGTLHIRDAFQYACYDAAERARYRHYEDDLDPIPDPDPDPDPDSDSERDTDDSYKEYYQELMRKEKLYCSAEKVEAFLEEALPRLRQYRVYDGTDGEYMTERVFQLDNARDEEDQLAVTLHGDILRTKPQVQAMVDLITKTAYMDVTERDIDAAEDSPPWDIEAMKTHFLTEGLFHAAMRDIKLLTGRDIASVRIGRVHIQNLDPREEGGEPVRTWPVSENGSARHDDALDEWNSNAPPTRGLLKAIGSSVTGLHLHFFATAEDIVAICASCPNLRYLQRECMGEHPDFLDRNSMTEYSPKRCLDVFVLLALAAPYLKHLEEIDWPAWPASAQWQIQQIKGQTGQDLLSSPTGTIRNDSYPVLKAINSDLPPNIKGATACLDTYNQLIQNVVGARHVRIELASPSLHYWGKFTEDDDDDDDDLSAAVGQRSEPREEASADGRGLVETEEAGEPFGLYGTAPGVEHEQLEYVAPKSERGRTRAWNKWRAAHSKFWRSWRQRVKGCE